MVKIQTDDHVLQKALEGLTSRIVAAGGGFHSDLVISAQNGDFLVKTGSPMAAGKEIIRLSPNALLSSRNYELIAQGSDFVMEVPPESTFSSDQRGIAESMIEVYNILGKVDQFKSTSFLFVFQDYPELLEKLEAGRDLSMIKRDWFSQIGAGVQGRELGKIIGDSFLKTRVLAYSDDQKQSKYSVLMPVIDFLNHHCGGAGFSIVSGVRQGDLVLHSAQPIEGSTECYATYGLLDAFDTFVRYNFVDMCAPFVRSVPLEFQGPDGEFTIKIGGLISAPATGHLANHVKDLKMFIPLMSLYSDKKTLTTSHIIIPDPKAPKAMRRILGVFLSNLYGETVTDLSVYKSWIAETERKIIDTNVKYYEDLKAFTETLVARDGEVYVLKSVIDLCDIQLKRLATYEIWE